MEALKQKFQQWFLEEVNLKVQEYDQILIQHFGFFQEDFIIRLSETIDDRLRKMGFSSAFSKRVYATVTEAITNVNKHGRASKLDVGSILIALNSDSVNVYVSNLIPVERREQLSIRINELNRISDEEVAERYTDLLKRSVVSTAQGFGLGFVAIRLKSDEPLLYKFQDLSEDYAIFTVKFVMNKSRE